MNQPVCAILGVGPGNGAAFAHRFATEGYRVALAARNQDYLNELKNRIDGAQVYPCDVTDVSAVEGLFKRIRSEMGPVQTLIYNAGAGAFTNIDETTPDTFENAWRVNALGCMVAAQQVIADMRAAESGNIIVIGATASRTGNAGFVPFASAKAAQRSLAQSLARHLGPDHIHVAYVVLDGVVDLQRTREAMPDKPDGFFMKPDEIADTVYYLTRQKPSAWTFELELRPFSEKW